MRRSLVRLPPLARDDRQQLLLAPGGRVARRGDRRGLPHAGGQVGEEALHLGERVVLVGRLVVHRAGARLRAGAAQLLLVRALPHRRGHHRRSRDEQLGGVAHDHREVRGHHARGAQPCDGSERRGHHRHLREVVHRQLPTRDEGHVGVAHRLERLHAAAAAGAVHQAHERHAQLVGQPLGVDHLLPDGGVGRAAANREVVALHHGRPAVDLATPHHAVGGQEVHELAVLVGPAAGELARLAEGALVEQPPDALAHGQAPARVLASDPLLAAHLLREPLAAAQLLELGLPGHGPEHMGRRSKGLQIPSDYLGCQGGHRWETGASR